MRIGRWLTQLAGARQDVLDQTPGDIPKQTSLGAVLVGTAMMAAVSATFGLVTAVHVPVAVAAMVGLLWGLLILNLDRMLVVSMARRSGVWANIGTAVPRLLLALLIGMVISLPLVLRIFEPEINAELQVMRNEALGQAQTNIDSNPRFAEIPALEAEEQRLQGVVSGTAADDVGSDPDVVRVQKELDAKEAEFTAAERDIICENDGTCGTGVVGRGPSYQEKLDKKNRLEAERNALRNQLAEAENAARQRVQSGNDRSVAAATIELERIQDELNTRRNERTFEVEKARAAEIQNDGLLARIEALDRLSAGRPTMWLAHLTLILMFVCIELLPVLVKLMSVTGPKSPYELVAERRDDDAVAADRIWSDKQRDIAEVRAKVRMKLEKHRADAQIMAGKAANDALVVAQQEIAERAVQVWAAVARQKADHELNMWFAQYGGGVPGQVTGPYTAPNGWLNGAASASSTNGAAGGGAHAATPSGAAHGGGHVNGTGPASSGGPNQTAASIPTRARRRPPLRRRRPVPHRRRALLPDRPALLRHKHRPCPTPPSRLFLDPAPDRHPQPPRSPTRRTTTPPEPRSFPTMPQPAEGLTDGTDRREAAALLPRRRRLVLDGGPQTRIGEPHHAADRRRTGAEPDPVRQGPFRAHRLLRRRSGPAAAL